MFSRIHCNYVFIFQDVSSHFQTFLTCYSTRWFLFSLEYKCFLHSVRTFAVCKIPSKEFFSCILCIYMMFIKFFWVCAKKFCVKLQLNSFLIFNSPAIRAKDLFWFRHASVLVRFYSAHF